MSAVSFGAAARGAIFVAAVAACGRGGETPQTPHAARPSTKHMEPVRDAGAADADAKATPPLASLDLLAQRLHDATPGLRELARGEVPAGETVALALPPEKDVCVRAAVSGGASLVLLTDGAAEASAPIDAEGIALVGARGPVCVARGDAASVRNASGAKARYVVFVAP